MYAFLVCSSSQTLTLYIARSGAISTSRRSYQIRHSVPVCFIECIWKLSRGEAFAVLICPLPPRGIWQLTWPLPWAFAFQGSKRGRGRGEGEKCEREKGPSLPNSSHKKNSDKQVTKLKVSVVCSHTLRLLLGYVDTAPDEFSSGWNLWPVTSFTQDPSIFCALFKLNFERL